ncbi:MAG TPA: hypothetical protein VNW92_23580, partial [Polyangiaceae bacterium]|nr:hypothetical protein [Polyangiaceae bacterium]
GMLGVSALLIGCNDPRLVLESPKDGTIITSPFAARVSWSAVNPVRNGPTITLDGADITNQFTFGYALVIDAADAPALRLPNGPHTMVASAQLENTDTSTWVDSVQTANFQVVDALFDVSIAPTTVYIAPGSTASAAISLTRTTAYTDSVAISVSTLPGGVTASALTIPANTNAGTLTFSADPSAPASTMTVMLTATGTTPPARTIMFQLVVAPTFTTLYNNYFAPTPATTPGHCYNCHQTGTPRTFFDPDNTQAGFYAALTRSPANLINLANPPASPFGSSTSSPLRWVNTTSGNMPFDNAAANPAAGADVVAWVMSGALNN